MQHNENIGPSTDNKVLIYIDYSWQNCTLAEWGNAIAIKIHQVKRFRALAN